MRRKLSVAVLVLCFLAAGCSQSALRKASIALRDFAVTLDAVEVAFIEAHAAGFIAKDDYDASQRVILEVAQDGQAAVRALRVEHSKPKAIEALNHALNGTSELLAQGSLHVKNPEKQAAIKALLISLRALLTTAEAFLQ